MAWLPSWLGHSIQMIGNALSKIHTRIGLLELKATMIYVIVNGGLKSLQIQDNGHGIKVWEKGEKREEGKGEREKFEVNSR